MDIELTDVLETSPPSEISRFLVALAQFVDHYKHTTVEELADWVKCDDSAGQVKPFLTKLLNLLENK